MTFKFTMLPWFSTHRTWNISKFFYWWHKIIFINTVIISFIIFFLSVVHFAPMICFVLFSDCIPIKVLPSTFYFVHGEAHHTDIGKSIEGVAGTFHLTHDLIDDKLNSLFSCWSLPVSYTHLDVYKRQTIRYEALRHETQFHYSS